MSEYKWFNPESSTFEEILVDEIGIPLTPERTEFLKNLSMGQDYEKILNEHQLKWNLALSKKPDGKFWFYNENEDSWYQMMPNPESPCPFQKYESWSQREDMLWYAPVDYPGEDPIRYRWDEFEQKWVDMGEDFEPGIS